MSEKPAVIIYSNRLLPPSATFIRSQAEALQKFIPYYAGTCRVPGLSIPENRTLVVSSKGVIGKLSELSHKLWGIAPNFSQRIRKLNPVLIHSHFGPDSVRILPLAKNLEIPLFATFHGYDITLKSEYNNHSYSYRFYLRRKEALKREAKVFIAVSKFIQKKLLDQGFPADKIVMHYIGVDTELFHPDSKIQHEPIVLFVGRLVEKKGCEYLIRAMQIIQAVKPDVELVVIGDGPLRYSLEQQAKKTLHRYRFLGVQSPENVRIWLNRASVFSVPSSTADSGDSEAFGIVFAEAQAMGLPVVSFAHGGIPEVVAHGETGFLASERNWEELAKYILLLLDDDYLWNRFSEAGMNRVRTLFNLQNQTNLLEEIYRQVLSDTEKDQ